MWGGESGLCFRCVVEGIVCYGEISWGSDGVDKDAICIGKAGVGA